MPDVTIEALWNLCSSCLAIVKAGHPSVLYRSTNGRLHWVCLEAAPEMALTLRGFRQALLISATYPPPHLFAQSIGLASGVYWLQGDAPWRESAYDCAIDARVDTRFQKRSSHLQTTAETISLMAGKSTGLCVVFFPAFQYAQQVFSLLKAGNTWLRVAIQPANDPGGLIEQDQFMQDALQFAHVLFLVMGSRYSEGIDHLGGKVSHAVVVGPALPEVNPVQEARMQQLAASGRLEAFRQVYQIPGILRIHQALGRLVRAPGHTTKVLFHCNRFADPVSQQLLDPVYRSATIIREGEDLLQWLNNGNSY
ncbi:MAG: hypothetical protein LR015_04465 [Verrucomicrobia bacterium]|nr:hypothetical protein [Verrucomicrobiota bacterium]